MYSPILPSTPATAAGPSRTARSRSRFRSGGCGTAVRTGPCRPPATVRRRAPLGSAQTPPGACLRGEVGWGTGAPDTQCGGGQLLWVCKKAWAVRCTCRDVAQVMQCPESIKQGTAPAALTSTPTQPTTALVSADIHHRVHPLPFYAKAVVLRWPPTPACVHLGPAPATAHLLRPAPPGGAPAAAPSPRSAQGGPGGRGHHGTQPPTPQAARLAATVSAGR